MTNNVCSPNGDGSFKISGAFLKSLWIIIGMLVLFSTGLISYTTLKGDVGYLGKTITEVKGNVKANVLKIGSLERGIATLITKVDILLKR